VSRLCDNCHKREAVMHVVCVIGDKKVDRWLCRECAAEMSSAERIGRLPDNPESVQKLLEEVFKPVLDEENMGKLFGEFTSSPRRELLRVPEGVYTRQATVVLDNAREWVREHRQRSLRPAHILWALLERESCYGAELLSGMGVKLDELRQQIRELIAYEDDYAHEPELSRATSRVLERAKKEARDNGVALVDTGYLLLGLLDCMERYENSSLFDRVKPSSDSVPSLTGEEEKTGESVHGKGDAVLLTEDLPAKLFPEVTAQKILRQIKADLEKEKLPEGNLLLEQQQNKERQLRLENALKHLEPFGENLNKLYRQGRLDPVIGRQKETEHLEQILCRRTKNNPVLIGEAGVGKTAIAEGLAERIVDGKVPPQLKDRVVFSVDLGSVLGGAKYKGELEERMQSIVGAASEAQDIILFMDEIHLLSSGGGDGTPTLGNILKPYLTRGDLHIIGATTTEEYRRRIEKDAALERRFQPIMVDAPNVDDTLEILQGLRKKYESYHGIKIDDEALRAAVKLSDRYISDRNLPDKAIDLLDEACSYLKLHPEAADLRENPGERESALQLTPIIIQRVITSWTGIPLEHLSAAESKNLIGLEERLHARVVGQETAVKAVARAVRRARAGLKDRNRPIGSFLFLGPTGVGKTELAKTLAENLFGDERSLIRFDMSEFSERHTVSRFIGAPPSYVGYEDGGELTKQISRRPYSVILLDEMEKAHPDVFNILLQIMEDGRLTDGQGRTVDFKNTVIVMTSNAGTEQMNSTRALGFGAAEPALGKVDKKLVLENIRKVFRPEFLNRLDDVIVFDALDHKELQNIVEYLLRDLEGRLADMGLKLTVTQEAKEYLLKEGTDARYGARPLRRAIRRSVEDRLADLYLEGVFGEGDNVLIDLIGGELAFSRVERLEPEKVSVVKKVCGTTTQASCAAEGQND